MLKACTGPAASSLTQPLKSVVVMLSDNVMGAVVASTYGLARRLRRKEASQYLLEKHGVTRSPATLAKDAVYGSGPRFQKLGNTPYYPREELDRWVEEQLTKPVRSAAEARQ